MPPDLMNSTVKSWFRAEPAGDNDAAVASRGGEPSLVEILLMLTTMAALHLLIVSRVKNFWDLAATWGDNSSYLAIAAIIRNWRFSGGVIPPHFGGFLMRLRGCPDS